MDITVYGHLTRTRARHFLNDLVEKMNAEKIQNTLLQLPGTVATLMEIIANHLNVPQGGKGGHHAL